MAMQLDQKNGGPVLEVRVTGKLTRPDYARFVPEFTRVVREQGAIRVLFNMVDFHGWDIAALWDDGKLALEHSSNIERLAMVGDKTWEREMSVLCRIFTSAQVRYFDHAAIEEARAWLESN
jgi:hypothetical protein